MNLIIQDSHVFFFIIIKGTPAFQCPEIANGDDTYHGFAIDIWSAGVTLYNLVTGRLPFEAENIYLLFQTIGRGVYTIPGHLDGPLNSLLTGLLQMDPLLRYKIEQIKQHDWFRRRPPRSFETLPIPKMALERFEKCTMFDYLTELHRPSDDDDQHSMKFIETLNQLRNQQARPSNGENLLSTKTRQRDQHRNCSIS